MKRNRFFFFERKNQKKKKNENRQGARLRESISVNQRKKKSIFSALEIQKKKKIRLFRRLIFITNVIQSVQDQLFLA